ncbi:gcn5-related N-acetyltransferase [Cupriavidus basilensis OR16]|uniref:Gcn5-related N-acetyltransferase n=1 Tax=Cupriavidus basilensis OR16 TaxID=1127483 RepID=H1SAF1_9BURK|nr:GNAT family N-acetyltransferase [Cupriavidus basilensis]EHP40424.1 gcn5-related N-acetyltransferase [Cupriavidus basilensis OR16]
MVKLQKASGGAAFALYRTNEAFFPLIGSVLNDEQDGVVYADHAVAPRQVYVEHAFGFAQIFGTPTPEFENALRQYLLVDKQFAAAKVRLYTPYLPAFLRSGDSDALRSYRQRFVFDSERGSLQSLHGQVLNTETRAGYVDQSNVAEIERRFGVVSRFWRSPDDFIAKAHAAVALVKGEMAAICYAAAVADGRAEIDVLTLPEYRHLGLGKFVVMLFNQNCRDAGLQPLWDCFANNSGSMALCRSIGFVPAMAAYPFFTINK